MAYDKVVDSTVLDGYFSDIADAIRSKDGTQNTYTPAQMPQAIEDIPSGGGDTLAQAMGGVLTGELVIDYGNKQYAAPGARIIFNSSTNTGITKIRYSCIEGCQEQSLSPIMTSSYNSGYALNEIDFGNLEATYFGLGDLSYGSWQNLTKVTANKLKRVNNAWGYFLKGSAISKADFPVLETIPNQGFNDCSQLEALILRLTNLVTLSNTNAFNGTPIASGTGYIYVPRDLVATYEAATNWSTYAGQFRALEDYTDDGTITGEFIMPTN